MADSRAHVELYSFESESLSPGAALKLFQNRIYDSYAQKFAAYNLCDSFNSIQIFFLKDLMIRNNESGFLSCKVDNVPPGGISELEGYIEDVTSSCFLDSFIDTIRSYNKISRLIDSDYREFECNRRIFLAYNSNRRKRSNSDISCNPSDIRSLTTTVSSPSKRKTGIHDAYIKPDIDILKYIETIAKGKLILKRSPLDDLLSTSKDLLTRVENRKARLVQAWDRSCIQTMGWKRPCVTGSGCAIERDRDAGGQVASLAYEIALLQKLKDVAAMQQTKCAEKLKIFQLPAKNHDST